MISYKLIRSYYVLLGEIASRLGAVDDKEVIRELHSAFKSYKGIGSLTEFEDNKDVMDYLSMIRMLCARERGWMVREPNEPEDIEQWSMKKFLRFKLHKYEYYKSKHKVEYA